MNELIKRLGALTAPCRGIDAEIHHWRLDGLGTGYRQDAPLYTASIDSAMTLVPEGGSYSLWRSIALPYPCHAAVSVDAFMTQVERIEATIAHQSMPIALCIAALKATQ